MDRTAKRLVLEFNARILTAAFFSQELPAQEHTRQTPPGPSNCRSQAKRRMLARKQPGRS